MKYKICDICVAKDLVLVTMADLEQLPPYPVTDDNFLTSYIAF